MLIQVQIFVFLFLQKVKRIASSGVGQGQQGMKEHDKRWLFIKESPSGIGYQRPLSREDGFRGVLDSDNI